MANPQFKTISETIGDERKKQFAIAPVETTVNDVLIQVRRYHGIRLTGLCSCSRHSSAMNMTTDRAIVALATRLITVAIFGLQRGFKPFSY